MIRPILAVRFSEATITATAKTPRPTRTAITTTVFSVPSIGRAGHEQSDRRDDGEHEFDPDAEHAAGGDRERGVGRGIAPGDEHLEPERQIARPWDDRCHAGRAEVRHHPAAHGQARHERSRQADPATAIQITHIDEQRDQVGVLERRDRRRRSRRSRGPRTSTTRIQPESTSAPMIRTARKTMLRTFVFFPRTLRVRPRRPRADRRRRLRARPDPARPELVRDPIGHP